MKILILGSEGNMGRRYTAICKWLGHEVDGYDITDGNFDQVYDTGVDPGWDRVIIATPTENHFGDCAWAIENYLPFLCEKPLSKDPSKIDALISVAKSKGVDGRMVCNWEFAIDLVLQRNIKSDTFTKRCSKLEYNCYNTGRDGVAWDCIQLIHLAGPENVTIKTDSPWMYCMVNGQEVTMRDIEQSYVLMAEHWLEDPNRLWSLEEAKAATEAVLEWEMKQ